MDKLRMYQRKAWPEVGLGVETYSNDNPLVEIENQHPTDYATEDPDLLNDLQKLSNTKHIGV